MVAKKSKDKQKKKKKGGMTTLIAGLFGALILIYLLNFAALLVLLGMLPTFVALYVDASPDRSHSKVVFACNASGVVPFIAALVVQGITSTNVHTMLLSAYTWFVMFGSAACGWGLVWGLPRLSHAVFSFMQNSNIQALEKKQQQIVDEWGPDVENTASRAMRNAAYKEEKKSEKQAGGGDSKRLPAPAKK